jgi:hypothetical protein
MRIDTWGTTAAVRLDQQLWNELVSLRFIDAHHGALLLGPVGVGKRTWPPRSGTSRCVETRNPGTKLRAGRVDIGQPDEDAHHATRWSLGRCNRVVQSSWQMTP